MELTAREQLFGFDNRDAVEPAQSGVVRRRSVAHEAGWHIAGHKRAGMRIIQASEREAKERHSYGELNHRDIWISYLMMMMLASIHSQNHPMRTSNLPEASHQHTGTENRTSKPRSLKWMVHTDLVENEHRILAERQHGKPSPILAIPVRSSKCCWCLSTTRREDGEQPVEQERKRRRLCGLAIEEPTRLYCIRAPATAASMRCSMTTEGV